MVLSGGEALKVQHDYATRVATKSPRLRRLVASRALNTRQVEPMVVSGPPDRGILQVAADIKADLIVMGVTPRSVLDERWQDRRRAWFLSVRLAQFSSFRSRRPERRTN